MAHCFTRTWIATLTLSLIPTFASAQSYDMDVGLKFGSNTWGYYIGAHDLTSRFGFFTTTELSVDPRSYGIGGTTTVCNDGQLSGSQGTGSCSWHGGVSHQTEAEYSRFSFGMGTTYRLSEPVSLVLNGVFSLYTHYITVGEASNEGDLQYGIETGVLVRPHRNFNIVGLYNSEISAFRLGFGTTFNF